MGAPSSPPCFASALSCRAHAKRDARWPRLPFTNPIGLPDKLIEARPG